MQAEGSGPTRLLLLLLAAACCGLPILLVALASSGGLAVVGAWRDSAWPLLAALLVLAGGVLLWRWRR